MRPRRYTRGGSWRHTRSVSWRYTRGGSWRYTRGDTSGVSTSPRRQIILEKRCASKGGARVAPTANSVHPRVHHHPALRVAAMHGPIISQPGVRAIIVNRFVYLCSALTGSDAFRDLFVFICKAPQHSILYLVHAPELEGYRASYISGRNATGVCSTG